LAFLVEPGTFTSLVGGDRAKALNNVRAVIQQSLRETLGAQFAASEGERMMKTAFDPLFDAKANFDLIADQVRLLETAARDQERAFNYYSTNGTIFGFKPKSDLVSPDGTPSLVRLSQIADSVMKGKSGEPTPEQIKAKDAEDRTQRVNKLLNAYNSYSGPQ
jgi:hypothetical protein